MTRLLEGLHAVQRATGFDWSIWVIAAGVTATVTGLVLRWLRRRDQPAARVQRLARRGRSVAAIARATGLAQDAVRDCLRDAGLPTGAAPSAAARRPGGTLFRRAERAADPPGPDFAAMLRASAARPTS